MVPMVQLKPCGESCEDTDSSSSSASTSSSGSEKAESSTLSVCSVDMSFSDSGKGTSEDDCHALAMAALNNVSFNGKWHHKAYISIFNIGLT